jgi:hypothetical protein
MPSDIFGGFGNLVTVDSYSWPGGAPVGGAQQFDGNYTLTNFAKKKDGDWLGITLTPGAWLINAMAIVQADAGVVAWGATVPYLGDTIPGDWDSLGWINTGTIADTDFVVWPTGFANVSQALRLSHPYVVEEGAPRTMLLAVGSDIADTTVTLRSGNPGDVVFYAVRLGDAA